MKMYSDKFYEQFSDYIEGNMAPQQRQEFETLLMQNPEAQRIVERIQVLRDQLRQLPAVTVSVDFEQRLHQRIQQDNSRRVLSLPFTPAMNWKTAISAAAVVLIATVSSLMMVDSEPVTIQLKAPQESTVSPLMSPKKNNYVSPTVQPSPESNVAKAPTDSADLKKKQQMRNQIQLAGEKVDRN